MTSDPQDLLRELIEMMSRLDLDALRGLDPEALDRALLGVSLLGSALTVMSGDLAEDVDLGAPLPVRDLSGVVIPIIDDDDPLGPGAVGGAHEEAG